ncbi:MAG: cell division protein FtsZ [Elusimicrobiota bacterium]|jgi:cell division protein FtsZ|nr:cell division protein FtsZ [Elusimicrobiota bacterium]
MEENSLDSLFTQAEQFEGKKAKIKCIGVGGGGGNAINHMMEAVVDDVDFIAINTDAQDLRRNKAPYLVQVGEKITKGLGVGGDPEKGKKAAAESIEQMRQIVADTDLLFITAGMGGGTGTGVAPELARIAKETYGDNILVVGVVTKPFRFEGDVRVDQAVKGIQELQKYADSMIIVPNDKLIENVDPTTPNDVAYKMVDEVLLQAVKGISEVILKPGQMNIDYNDLKKVMLNAGRSLIGIGQASGAKRHLSAISDAVSSPLLENADITGAKGYLVFFTAADSLTLLEQAEAMNIIRQYASSSSIIKFGYMYDKNMPSGTLKITVIATGFGRQDYGRVRRPVVSVGLNNRPTYSPINPLGQNRSVATKQNTAVSSLDDEMSRLIPAYIRRQKEGR